MAIFDNNKFRVEEQLGGFKVGSSDQELFYLNTLDEYPGILPDFEFEEQSISQLLSEREGIPYEKINKKIDLSDSNSIEPVIDISPIEVETANNDIIGDSFIKDRNTNVDNDLDELPSYNPNIFDDENEVNFGSPISYKVEKKIKNYDDNFNSLNNTDSDFNINSGELDSDLNSLLEEGLSLSKIRKNKSNENINENLNENPDGNYSMFDNIGESAFGEINPDEFNVAYDFDDIKAGSPSKMGIENLENEQNPEEITENKEDENKKKKKGLALWQIIAISVAATLVLVSIVGLVVYKIINKPKEDHKELAIKDKNHNSKKSNKKTNHTVEHENTHATNSDLKEYDSSKSRKSELVAENDDVKVELKVEVKPENNHNKHIDKTLDKNSSKNHNSDANHFDSHNKNTNDKNNEHKTNFEGKITFKDKPKEHLEINSKTKTINKVTNKELHSEHSSTEKDSKHDEKNHNNSQNKSQEKNTKKEIILPAISFKENINTKNKEKNKIEKEIENGTFFEKPNEKNISLNNTNTKKENNLNNPEIYSVQVYSTLSKSDAMDMVEKIKKMGISDAFISKQNLRDEIWYRVRYGNFASKDEAKTSASKFGFSQIWIDRIK